MKIIIFISLITLSSCGVLYYEPSSPNIPLFDSSHVYNIDITYSTHGIGSKTNVRLLKYGFMQFEYNKFSEQNNYAGGAIGCFYQNKLFHVSIASGYGEGNTDFYEGTGGSSYDFYGYGRFNKYFIHPLIAVGNKNNKIGVSLKLTYLDYMIKDYNSRYVDLPTNIIIGKYYKCYSFEPTLFYRYYFNYALMLTTYVGTNTFNTEIPYKKLDESKILIGISIGLYLDKNIWFKNLK